MPAKRSEDYAVVVGINRYSHPFYDSLEGAVVDAEAFYQWLTSKEGGNLDPKNVLPHYSDDEGLAPRQDQIYDSFKQLLRKSKGGAERIGRRLYIFLAGHGVSDSLDSAGLLAADHSEEADSYIPAKTIADLFRKGGLFREVLLFVDCCRDYEENLSNPYNPFKVTPDPAAAIEVKHCYAFAANPYGKSYEDEFEGRCHGVFSWALLEGLRGYAAGEDHRVTAGSLAEFVRQRYGDASERPDFHPKFPEIVLAEGVEPPRTPIEITLDEPDRGFEVRDGLQMTTVLEPPIEELAEDRWRVMLRPGRLYVIAIPDGKGWFGRSVPVDLKGEKIDVRL